MGEVQTLTLGLIAGATILLGLPLGRLRNRRHNRTTAGLRVSLNAIAVGILLLGTAVGHEFTNDAVSLVFLTLAAGSILYVILQLVAVALAGGHRHLLYGGVWAGLLAGFATNMVLTSSGA